MSVAVRVRGEREIINKLNRLETKIQTKIVRQTLREAAKPVLKEVKAAIPKRSGALRKATKLRTMKRKKGRIGITIGASSLGDYQGKQFYGAFVEYGYTDRGGGKHEGQQNIKRAYDKTKDATAKYLQQVLLRRILANAK